MLILGFGQVSHLGIKCIIVNQSKCIASFWLDLKHLAEWCTGTVYLKSIGRVPSTSSRKPICLVPWRRSSSSFCDKFDLSPSPTNPTDLLWLRKHQAPIFSHRNHRSNPTSWLEPRKHPSRNSEPNLRSYLERCPQIETSLKETNCELDRPDMEDTVETYWNILKYALDVQIICEWSI